MRLPPATRRAVAALSCGAIIGGILSPVASASMLDSMLRQRRHIGASLATVRSMHQEHAGDLRVTIARSERALRRGAQGRAIDRGRWRQIGAQIRHARWEAETRLRRLDRFAARRRSALLRRRAQIDAWLDTWAIFRTCPVAGWHVVADNYGITVRLDGVPTHRHLGNDIAAYSGTPIVAPFDGYASASSSALGGLEVRVTGARGYVYNAHLGSYGWLGFVPRGAVVGYVGSTGDATTPHDHFEWHPWGGAAVDPNPYLNVVC